MKIVNVSYGGFEAEQSVDECLYDAIYNKAIDDFADRLCHKIKYEIDDCADELDWIDEIAEQLKEGGENDA